jgi:hypothetical protein
MPGTEQRREHLMPLVARPDCACDLGSYCASMTACARGAAPAVRSFFSVNTIFWIAPV